VKDSARINAQDLKILPSSRPMIRPAIRRCTR
jgi:hypothetical protein